MRTLHDTRRQVASIRSSLGLYLACVWGISWFPLLATEVTLKCVNEQYCNETCGQGRQWKDKGDTYDPRWVTFGEFPSFAQILYKQNGTNSTFYGTIVSEYHILTVGLLTRQVQDLKAMRVYVGTHLTLGKAFERNGAFPPGGIEVAAMCVDPNSDPAKVPREFQTGEVDKRYQNRGIYDSALLLLKRRLRTYDQVQPACWPNFYIPWRADKKLTDYDRCYLLGSSLGKDPIKVWPLTRKLRVEQAQCYVEFDTGLCLVPKWQEMVNDTCASRLGHACLCFDSVAGQWTAVGVNLGWKLEADSCTDGSVIALSRLTPELADTTNNKCKPK